MSEPGPERRGPPAKSRRRRRKPRPEVPPAETLAAEVYKALDALVARVARDEGLTLSRAGEPEPTLVPLALGPRGGREAALLGFLRDHLGAAHRERATFVEGAVYCFHTDQPESPYSRPTQPTEVFAGYAAHGKPEWQSFANLCLERREPRVDRLFGDTPEVLALIMGPDTLADGMLPSFRRGEVGWRLLGQVAVGLVPRDFDPKSREERVALTLQVIETSEPDGRDGLTRRLRLNVIGVPMAELAEVAASGEATSPAEAFRRVLRATRGRVDALGRRAALAHRQGGRFDLNEPVMQLLTRLRGDVLRVLKSRDYRTQHAQERHHSGERPTALAIADALAAGDGRFLRDEHKDTVVVLGPKQRVHVFSTAGRHVTSLELTPNEVARRVDLRRWKYLERPLSDLFKGTLKRQLEGGA